MPAKCIPEAHRAWWDALCRRPMPVRLKGDKTVTLLCMRERGHQGPCMEALAA